jgi:hypothetical protein
VGFLSDIRDHLLGDDTLKNLVGERIHPVRLPQTCVWPAVRMEVVSSLPEDVADGASALKRTRLQVDAYALRVEDAHSVADAIEAEAVLGGYRGTVGETSIASSVLDAPGRFDRVQTPVPGSDDWRWQTTLDFLVHHT